MNEVQKNIDTAFNLISTIPVNGDNVEKMADAKNYLRAAYAKAGEMCEKGKENLPQECSEEVDNG